LGKTVPSYRMPLEFEIATWKAYRKALPTAEDREAFDTVMNLYRGFGFGWEQRDDPDFV